MSQSRLFDLRAYKSVLAELSYYRRLARAGAPSAHVATSMPQLIKGLARLHPSWKMTGDPLEDRDRHHSAVRRRLRAMVEAELIVWTRGVNLDGEEARTELLLLEPPQVTPQELAAARAQLAKWRVTHGNRLNTGSSTGIRDIAKVAALPSPAERCTRARNRVQQLRAARIRGALSPTKTAPPFGTAVWLYQRAEQPGRRRLRRRRSRFRGPFSSSSRSRGLWF